MHSADLLNIPPDSLLGVKSDDKVKCDKEIGEVAAGVKEKTDILRTGTDVFFVIRPLCIPQSIRINSIYNYFPLLNIVLLLGALVGEGNCRIDLLYGERVDSIHCFQTQVL